MKLIFLVFSLWTSTVFGFEGQVKTVVLDDYTKMEIPDISSEEIMQRCRDEDQGIIAFMFTDPSSYADVSDLNIVISIGDVTHLLKRIRFQSLFCTDRNAGFNMIELENEYGKKLTMSFNNSDSLNIVEFHSSEKHAD